LPVLDSQKQVLREAGAALDEIRSGALRDFRAALAYEPTIQRAMTEFQGRERAARLVKVCQRLEARHERLPQHFLSFFGKFAQPKLWVQLRLDGEKAAYCRT
jgi:hypothetical protein